MSPQWRRMALGTILGAFDGTQPPPWALSMTRDGLAGFVLFGGNVADPAQLASLCATLRSARTGILLAIDEEGGPVTRLYRRDSPWHNPSPGNAALGAADDIENTRRVYARIGADLAQAGIGLDLAPVVDVAGPIGGGPIGGGPTGGGPTGAGPTSGGPTGPGPIDGGPIGGGSVVGVRSFGADPRLVARHTAAAIDGLRDAGIATCAKHFPGHGGTAVDSHRDSPVVDVPLDLLRERDLPPFAAAIAAGVAAVMTAHLSVPALTGQTPATFSSAAVALLRRGLGFDGVIVTDALEMRGAMGWAGSISNGAVLALEAGVDLLCVGHRATESLIEEIVDAIAAAIASGRLPAARVAEAAARVAALGPA